MKKTSLILFLIVISLKLVAEVSVGTPKGNLSVNGMGAAVYNMNFEIPNGGGIEPQVGIAYNSQMNCYGAVGYGFDITGISVITSGGKDTLHDSAVKGHDYLADSSFFLDGKRLILQEGNVYSDSAVYSPEGNPYVKVIRHGGFSQNNVSAWFEVIEPGGTKYTYGNSTSSRLTFKNSSTDYMRCTAWYITQCEDIHSNRITYSYYKDQLNIYPLEINYGYNSLQPRYIVNTISFSYTDIPQNNIKLVRLGNQSASIRKKLSAVTTKTNTRVFRRYEFEYTNNDADSSINLTQLSSITEYNGNGDNYPAISFEWDNAHQSEITVNDYSFSPLS